MACGSYMLDDIRTFGLWEKTAGKRLPVCMELELTARCNLNCRHCYINVPAGSDQARKDELSVDEILRIAEEARDMGTLFCVVSGGEPLLRPDFPDLYVGLKRLGLAVSLFTNATMITRELAELLHRYPPKDIEISVYGASEQVYEKITRQPGSYRKMLGGIALLRDVAQVRIRTKAVIMRSNIEEMDAIGEFCRSMTKDFYRFDPMLQLRFDRDPMRNREIIEERLDPETVAELDWRDRDRARAILDEPETLIFDDGCGPGCTHLLRCGAGVISFAVAYDGTYRACGALVDRACGYDLRAGSLREAWDDHTPELLKLKSDRPKYKESCATCKYPNLCLSCPAISHLECGVLDEPTPYFCEIAHARYRSLVAKVGEPAGAEA